MLNPDYLPYVLSVFYGYAESNQSGYQETSAVTNDFNHRNEDYVSFISANLSAHLMSTQNDGQNNGR